MSMAKCVINNYSGDINFLSEGYNNYYLTNFVWCKEILLCDFGFGVVAFMLVKNAKKIIYYYCIQ